ncbi:anti-repressor SinI family protein [Virgibacillus halophilus]|uniref:Anti-repressor SinI family protein n=1 Tax=Tigheibacillus halophilus TaxID=361280 RepID=A0ABU5C6G9_9BACI|nr:anti-repressor SinI family protein [Virgibacillus halophilus]
MQELDTEWVELIITAKQSGLSKEDVREFLKEKINSEAWPSQT